MLPVKSLTSVGSEPFLSVKEEKVEQLFRRYHSGLVIRASGVVGELFAEEVVQDAWLTLLEVWDTIRDKESVGPWLNKVVLNRSLIRLKREKRSVPFEQVLTEDHIFKREFENNTAPMSDEPESNLSLQQKLEEFEAIWHRLSLNQQNVCEMRLVHGYKYEQIADRLGVSISNSKVILHRAKASLMDALQ